jgi:flagellar biosynthesis/type III secretory pathway protein FliH
MTNNKQQTAVEWFSVRRDVLEIEVRLGKLSPIEYAEELTKAEQQAKEMEKDEMESVIIKQCAEQSTSEASKYAEGYKEGYNRALELTKWTISNLIPPHNEQRQ